MNLISVKVTKIKTTFEGRMTGIEPANDGITTRCRNHLATLAFNNISMIVYY
jgi:hypothetical protein